MDKKELLDWVIMDIGCKCKYLEDVKKKYNLKFIDPTSRLEKGIIAMREIFKILSKEPEEEPVLDDAERRYLKNVIRPFKDKCEYVEKIPSDWFEDKAYILISLENANIPLPMFEKNTLYINMEPCKKYTLEDLEIKYDK